MDDAQLSLITGLQDTQRLAIILLCVLATLTLIGCVDGFMGRRAALPQSYSMALLFKLRAGIRSRLMVLTVPMVRWASPFRSRSEPGIGQNASAGCPTPTDPIGAAPANSLSPSV